MTSGKKLGKVGKSIEKWGKVEKKEGVKVGRSNEKSKSREKW